MKRISILITLLLLPIAFAAVPQEEFYSAGSDFLIIQNPDSTAAQSPRFYAPYDNTQISFDINNDGAIDYRFTVNKGGPYTFTTAWNIIDGTRVSSSKPIVYQQIFYYQSYVNQWNGPTSIAKHTIIPPTNHFRQVYMIMPGDWKFISDNINQTIFIDENFDGTAEKTLSVSRNSSKASVNSHAIVYSNQSFFSYSNTAIAGGLSTDFITSKENVYIIVPEDSTSVAFDYNADTVRDYTLLLNRGNYSFNTTAGARVMSAKNISVFDYSVGEIRIKYEKILTPAVTAKEVSGEFMIASQGSGESIVGIFNNESTANIPLYLSLYQNTSSVVTLYNQSNISTSLKIPLLYSSIYLGNATIPLTGYYEYYYHSNSYPEYKYFAGRNMAYKSVYITASPKSKIITNSSTLKMNVRVFNPYKDSSVNNILITFPVNNYFSLPIATVNYRKAYLTNDGVIESSSKAITLANDGVSDYFIFEYSGVLGPETYLDVDFDLATPETLGSYSFSPATLAYASPTWII